MFAKQALRNLEINPIVLAPLAGVSDQPFRRLNQSFGAQVTYVEMLSAVAIHYRNQKTLSLMKRHEEETCLGVQVTGSNSQDLKKALQYLNHLPFDAIDLNLGCPVRKVIQSGCGAALMKDLKNLRTIFEVARETTSKPLTAKFRLGWTREAINCQKVAQMAFECGLEGITLHGRTRSERYNQSVDYELIQETFEPFKNHSFLCLGNGDVFDWSSSFKMKQAQAKGVMVSRGALGNPWIFHKLLSNSPRDEEPTLEEWKETILKHLQLQKEHYGDNLVSTKMMRKHLIWYAKGFPNIKKIRPQLGLVQSLKEAKYLIESYAKSQKSDLRREPSKILEPNG